MWDGVVSFTDFSQDIEPSPVLLCLFTVCLVGQEDREREHETELCLLLIFLRTQNRPLSFTKHPLSFSDCLTILIFHHMNQKNQFVVQILFHFLRDC